MTCCLIPKNPDFSNHHSKSQRRKVLLVVCISVYLFVGNFNMYHLYFEPHNTEICLCEQPRVALKGQCYLKMSKVKCASTRLCLHRRQCFTSMVKKKIRHQHPYWYMVNLHRVLHLFYPIYSNTIGRWQCFKQLKFKSKNKWKRQMTLPPYCINFDRN